MSKLSLTNQTLPNGFRIVLIDLPGFHSVTNFLTIRSGSRYETAQNNGIAHFLEHMVFKGTKQYPGTLELAEAIEGIGGYFNAWTSVDHTAYWNVVPSKHWQVGLNLPFELAYRALLRPEDLERERGVIIEEIRMIQDDPARYVDDLSQELLFDGHPLAQQIIGSEATIKAMKITDFTDYRQAHYAPSQSLFIAIGDLSGKNIVKAVSDQLSDQTNQAQSRPTLFPSTSHRALKLLSKKTDQTHFMLAMADPSLAFTKKERFVGVVLNTILGRGMSSRLFMNVREKQGLAYAIRSSMNDLEDTGSINIYGGVNTTKVDQALRAVAEELEKLRTTPVGSAELQKAKTYITGSYDLKSDDSISLAQWYGTSALLGQQESFEEAKQLVEAVTASDIQKLAQRLFAKELLTLAVIGPYDSDQQFRDFLGLA